MNRLSRIVLRMALVIGIVFTPLLGMLEPVSSQGAGATLRLVMRGCPEGFDPNGGNWEVECTIPLDAPDASLIGSDFGTSPITSLNREWDGGYVYYTDPGAMSVYVSGLAPVLRDGYQVWNFDENNGETYTFHLREGEVREARVFYYYNLNPAPAPAGVTSTTVEIATPNVAGYPTMGVCYELVELGRSACIEPGADIVVFADVPSGTYTARQTADLGENYVVDFTIQVTGDSPVQREAGTAVTPWGSPSRIGKIDEVGSIDYDFATWPGNTDNISVVFMDTATGEIARTNGCVQIVNITGVGCDTNTGRIDFTDVPVGPHQIQVTTVPGGYKIAPRMEILTLENPGGTPNGPMRVVYFIDIEPVGGSYKVDSPIIGESKSQVDSGLLTICASNHHGIALPSMYFNLTPEAAIASGLMVEDAQGNLVPEWTGVREGECQLSVGFQLYESVPNPNATVEYCDNGVAKRGPANTIGADVIDPIISGEPLYAGTLVVDWRSAPDGVTPGPCSMPIGFNGPKLLGEIEGTWTGFHRIATFNPDGTGLISYIQPSLASVEFSVELDLNTYPLQATVVTVTPTGSPDLTGYPVVGDVLIVNIEPVGVVTVNLSPDHTMYMCAPDATPNTFNQKCFD